jgi:hypothetical protein
MDTQMQAITITLPTAMLAELIKEYMEIYLCP